jgi:acetyl-CoA decarbonylase/synthase complex subunit gamma
VVRPIAVIEAAAALCAWSSLAAFLGMLFTGASTFTSLSGVRREMRLAVPAEAALALVGGVLMCL